MKKNMKTILLLSLIAVMSLVTVLFAANSAKPSGWLLTNAVPVAPLYQLVSVADKIIIGALLLSLILSIYYIIKGKTKKNEDGTKAKNPLRRVGVVSLVWTILAGIFLNEIAVGHMKSAEFALVYVAALGITLIYLLAISIKHKVKKVMLPSLCIILVCLNMIFTSFMPMASYTRGASSTKGMSNSGFSSVQSSLAGNSLAGGLNTKMSMSAGVTDSFLNAVPNNVSNNIGFSVGGAKDINNFRDNIKNNFLPLPTDVIYEGLFYDYYFDTGVSKKSDKLFSPSYISAITKDPISGKTDYYLSVGLNSNIKAEDFKRKKLNIVVVLDISGSMGDSFNSYYYDNQKPRLYNPEENSSKLTVAAKSIGNLINHLGTEDRFGMVIFDDVGVVAKELGKIKDCDVAELKSDISKLAPGNSTNMEDGYKKATELFKKISENEDKEYENRIILLTDAMPNTGDIGQDSLTNMFRTNAENKIYSTFIGIGVDFNTELIDSVSKTRGANYYKVSSTEEFKNRMDKEFDYMVTPLVFNLELKLDAKGYSIENVYGSPEANLATGEIMKVNTLFPSESSSEGTKGGVILLKLKKLTDDSSLNISVSYEDREGNKDESSENIILQDNQNEYFGNSGIRKAVLLARYADLLKDWMIDERQNYDTKVVKPLVSEGSGITVPPAAPMLGRWERQSISLKVSDKYKETFKQFITYFEQEAKEVNDKTLDQEKETLNKLAK